MYEVDACAVLLPTASRRPHPPQPLFADPVSVAVPTPVALLRFIPNRESSPSLAYPLVLASACNAGRRASRRCPATPRSTSSHASLFLCRALPRPESPLSSTLTLSSTPCADLAASLQPRRGTGSVGMEITKRFFIYQWLIYQCHWWVICDIVGGQNGPLKSRLTEAFHTLLLDTSRQQSVAG